MSQCCDAFGWEGRQHDSGTLDEPGCKPPLWREKVGLIKCYQAACCRRPREGSVAGGGTAAPALVVGQCIRMRRRRDVATEVLALLLWW